MSKFKEWSESLMEFLNGQQWFQELRGHWDALDQQAKNTIALGSAAGGLLLVLLVVLSSIWRVNTLRSELAEKQELLSFIQTSSNEMIRLKDTTASANRKGAGGADAGPWTAYFESIALNSGIEKGNVIVGTEKSATDPSQMSSKSSSSSSSTVREIMTDITTKKINIKQLIQFAYNLENGQRIVKLRNLNVDTKGDPTGYLEATFSVSGLSLVPPKQ